jgi:hypothetical protein
MIKDMIFRFELLLSFFPASPPRFELAIYLEIQDDSVSSPCLEERDRVRGCRQDWKTTLAPTLALVRERKGNWPHPQK